MNTDIMEFSKVVCDSTLIIQLLSCLLDKKTKYYLCGSDVVQPLPQSIYVCGCNKHQTCKMILINVEFS